MSPFLGQPHCPPRSSHLYLQMDYSEETHIHVDAGLANGIFQETWSPIPIKSDSRAPVRGPCNACWNGTQGAILPAEGSYKPHNYLPLDHDSFRARRKRQCTVAVGQYSTSELNQDPNPRPTPSLQDCQSGLLKGRKDSVHSPTWQVGQCSVFLLTLPHLFYWFIKKKKKAICTGCVHGNHWSREWSQVVVWRMSFWVHSLKFFHVFSFYCVSNHVCSRNWTWVLCESTCKHMCMLHRHCNDVIYWRDGSVVLPKEPGSIPTTPMVAHNYLLTPVRFKRFKFKGFNRVFWALSTPGIYVSPRHTCR